MADSDPAAPKNLDTFLDKVDELESIVKGFISSDDETVKEMVTRADELLAKVKEENKLVTGGTADADENLPKTKTGYNKTMINKAAFDNAASGIEDPNYDGMDQNAFMKAMEADADERARERQKREKVASGLKEKGNEEFRQGNYEQALDWYTQALRDVKDNTALYTNRAQTYIKLGKYPEAIIDCDWALRVFPNCLKAHIHMGRAHLMLKEYQDARDCYNKALTCDPKKEGLIKEYLAEVDRDETAEIQEADAEKLFTEGNMEDVGIVEIIERAQKPDQLPMFYSGGFRILKGLLKNISDRTLFRTHGGMDMVTKHASFHRCLSASPRSLSQEELDMVAAGFDMFTEACTDNDKNMEALLHTEYMPDKCLRFLEVKVKGQGRVVKLSIVNCLYTISQLEIGRRQIVTSYNIPKLMGVLFMIVRTSSVVIGVAAANLINNLALDKKFKAQFRDNIEENVLPSFELLLREGSSIAALPSCISMMTNLSGDQVIRSKLIARKQLWEASSNIISEHRSKMDQSNSVDILESILGLLLNLTTESSQYLREFGVPICDHCLAMLKNSVDQKSVSLRVLSLMSNILPHCIPSVDLVCEKGGTAVLLGHVMSQDEEMKKSSIKALTACTQINADCRKEVVDHKGLGPLIRLLKNEDEIVVGNAALCLSHCSQVAKVCTALTKTDIIKELLVLARDGKRPAVQSNCAILIAKLAQGDSKHLDRLRELHGVEILHSCMKYLK